MAHGPVEGYSDEEHEDWAETEKTGTKRREVAAGRARDEMGSKAIDR